MSECELLLRTSVITSFSEGILIILIRWNENEGEVVILLFFWAYSHYQVYCHSQVCYLKQENKNEKKMKKMKIDEI